MVRPPVRGSVSVKTITTSLVVLIEGHSSGGGSTSFGGKWAKKGEEAKLQFAAHPSP